MIILRRDKERLYLKQGNHESWSTFDAQDQANPHKDGFGLLESLEENRLPPSASVAPALCKESEIITYVIEGVLAFVNTTGSPGIINAGEFHRMTAGARIHHSERNASQSNWAHIFQLSLYSCRSEVTRTVEQKLFPVAKRRGALCIIASGDGRMGSLRLQQNVLIYSTILDAGQHLVYEIPQGRIAWLHIVRGKTTLGNFVLTTGDGAGIFAESAISFTADEESEILLLDMSDNDVYLVLPQNARRGSGC